MKSILLAPSLVFLSLVFMSHGLFAAEAPSRDDAKALVKQAAAYAKENGRDKFFNEVRRPKGRFHFQEGAKKGLYIFVYDEKGVVLAHGVRLELTGKNRWNNKDPGGKPWVHDWTDLVHKSGSGWISYKGFNPANNNQIMDKSSFVELVDGMIIGCGIYEK